MLMRSKAWGKKRFSLCRGWPCFPFFFIVAFFFSRVGANVWSLLSCKLFVLLWQSKELRVWSLVAVGYCCVYTGHEQQQRKKDKTPHIIKTKIIQEPEKTMKGIRRNTAPIAPWGTASGELKDSHRKWYAGESNDKGWRKKIESERCIRRGSTTTIIVTLKTTLESVNKHGNRRSTTTSLLIKAFWFPQARMYISSRLATRGARRAGSYFFIFFYIFICRPVLPVRAMTSNTTTTAAAAVSCYCCNINTLPHAERFPQIGIRTVRCWIARESDVVKHVIWLQ